MTSRRVQKVAEAVREVVSMAILAELKDPRVRDVTVTYVEMSPDLRHAKVHVSVMGDEAKQRLSLAGLAAARPASSNPRSPSGSTRATLRKIEFLLDQGVKRSIEVARILREVLPPPQEPTEAQVEEQFEEPFEDADETHDETSEEAEAQGAEEDQDHPDAQGHSGVPPGPAS